MKKFEYKIIFVKKEHQNGLQDVLNEIGKDGFELINFREKVSGFDPDFGDMTEIELIFKRELNS
ncbi:MAG: DUF4177 domain-containing protein [Bacteroidales bacterium]|jgi:hypothetical protein|nr:DUF4177 domain-containing protein [Bacteroidales bacterium]